MRNYAVRSATAALVIMAGGFILSGCGSSGNDAKACSDAETSIEANVPTGFVPGSEQATTAAAGLMQAHSESGSDAVGNAIIRVIADLQGGRRGYDSDYNSLKTACGSNWS